MLKHCSDCQEHKPLTEFWVARTGKTKDGYKPVCKQCNKRKRREWAAKHRSRESEWNRAKHQANPQIAKAQSKRWREEHPERAKAIHRMAESARRTRKRNQFVENVDPQVVYEMHGGRCGICDEFIQGNFHVDHIVPVSRGGLHCYLNVQPAHPTCNLEKAAS